jgi:hypothetical protein
MTAMDVDEDDDDDDSHTTLKGREGHDTDQDAEQFYQDSQEVGHVTAAMSQASCDANSPPSADSAADSILGLSDHTVTMTDSAITQVAAPPPLEYSACNPATISDMFFLQFTGVGMVLGPSQVSVTPAVRLAVEMLHHRLVVFQCNFLPFPFAFLTFAFAFTLTSLPVFIGGLSSFAILEHTSQFEIDVLDLAKFGGKCHHLLLFGWLGIPQVLIGKCFILVECERHD